MLRVGNTYRVNQYSSNTTVLSGAALSSLAMSGLAFSVTEHKQTPIWSYVNDSRSAKRGGDVFENKRRFVSGKKTRRD